MDGLGAMTAYLAVVVVTAQAVSNKLWQSSCSFC